MATAYPATVGHLTQAGERSWKLLLMRITTGLSNSSDRHASGSLFPISLWCRQQKGTRCKLCTGTHLQATAKAKIPSKAQAALHSCSS